MKTRWVGWMSTKFPLEIPAALDLTMYCPESFAAAAALRGGGDELCRAAERLGYVDDLCSYTRMGLAKAAGAETGGDLPRPDFLLCCDNICSNMIQWYQEMARLLDVPLYLLDIPFQDGPEVSAGTVGYIRCQLEEIIRHLEELTGRTWEDRNFQQACRNANASAEAWQEVLDAALADPSPVENLELFDYMPLLVTGRCRRSAADQLRQAARMLRQRPAHGEKRSRRVFFEGTPCWPALASLAAQLDRRNLRVVADTLSPSLGFRYQDLDGMIRAYCGTINGTSLEAGVRTRTALCRRFGAEAVLVHYNRSCRPWCGSLPEVERCLRRELQIPVVSFGGDQGDPRCFSAAQLETRLDGLAEILEAREDA